jgi:hypothetical protein
MLDETTIGQMVIDALLSVDIDGSGEQANIVDGLFAIARAINNVAVAISPEMGDALKGLARVGDIGPAIEDAPTIPTEGQS